MASTPYHRPLAVASRPPIISNKDGITLRIHGNSWAEVMEGKALGLSCEATGNNIREAYTSSRSPESPLIEWMLDDVPVNMLFNSDKVSIYLQKY